MGKNPHQSYQANIFYTRGARFVFKTLISDTRIKTIKMPHKVRRSRALRTENYKGIENRSQFFFLIAFMHLKPFEYT